MTTTEATTPAAPTEPGVETAEKGAARPLIREWQSMSPAEQATEWQALIGWVIWIHDQYELSREERLPLCWPRHPGLVEELRSLKAWRDLIYDTPAAASTPHAARSWHGELRQTIAAALQFWAPGCRAGHTDAQLLADADDKLAAQWRAMRPPVMASAPLPPAKPATPTDSISDDAMTAAITAGSAFRHSRDMPYYAHHDDTWWTRSDDVTTWYRCTDGKHAAKLDRTSRQLRGADAAHDKHTHGKDGQ